LREFNADGTASPDLLRLDRGNIELALVIGEIQIQEAHLAHPQDQGNMFVGQDGRRVGQQQPGIAVKG
jgi:hypothetical protein